MAIEMSDAFRKKFPFREEDVITPSPEKWEQIREALIESLALVQEQYERELRSPSAEVLNRAMTY